MLKVGDLVLWGINVDPAWHIVVERTKFTSTTQYSFVTLTDGVVTAEWVDSLEDLNERYKDYITSQIRPDYSPSIEEIKKETNKRIKSSLEENINMMEGLGYHADQQKVKKVNEWLDQ